VRVGHGEQVLDERERLVEDAVELLATVCTRRCRSLSLVVDEGLRRGLEDLERSMAGPAEKLKTRLVIDGPEDNRIPAPRLASAGRDLEDHDLGR